MSRPTIGTRSERCTSPPFEITDRWSRFGFRPGAAEGFRKPSLRIPDEAFQVARLGASEPWMSGTLVYSQTFWDHDAVGLRDDAQVNAAAPGPTGADAGNFLRETGGTGSR